MKLLRHHCQVAQKLQLPVERPLFGVIATHHWIPAKALQDLPSKNVLADLLPTATTNVCGKCGKVLKGGRWALQAHQLTSSKCAEATGNGPAREPCPVCGKMIAARMHGRGSSIQHVASLASMTGTIITVTNPPPGMMAGVDPGPTTSPRGMTTSPRRMIGNGTTIVPHHGVTTP